MSAPRIVIEARFSLERRSQTGRTFELGPLPDFLVVHALKSTVTSELPAGASLLANPQERVQVVTGGPGEHLLIRLAPELLVEAAARLRMSPTGAQMLFRAPLTREPRLADVAATIVAEMDEAAAGWREVIAALVDQLAVYLLRSHINVRRSDEIELSRVGLVDRRLRRALEYMHDHCGRELNLNEIAGAAYLSPFHFARLFKQIIGQTPHAYLAALRIERARRLLAETDLPIGEVGAQVGYENQSHFTKIFRVATGLTPLAFRRAAQASPG
jgi:AraC family transcriptional regulator